LLFPFPLVGGTFMTEQESKVARVGERRALTILGKELAITDLEAVGNRFDYVRALFSGKFKEEAAPDVTLPLQVEQLLLAGSLQETDLLSSIQSVLDFGSAVLSDAWLACALLHLVDYWQPEQSLWNGFIKQCHEYYLSAFQNARAEHLLELAALRSALLQVEPA
jgi:hypothetical protein